MISYFLVSRHLYTFTCHVQCEGGDRGTSQSHIWNPGDGGGLGCRLLSFLSFLSRPDQWSLTKIKRPAYITIFSCAAVSCFPNICIWRILYYTIRRLGELPIGSPPPPRSPLSPCNTKPSIPQAAISLRILERNSTHILYTILYTLYRHTHTFKHSRN